MEPDSICITFDDNALLPSLYGEQDKHLECLEKQLDVLISSRGNVVSLSGSAENVGHAERVLESLYHRLQQGDEVSFSDVEAAIRLVSGYDADRNGQGASVAATSLFEEDFIIQTTKRNIIPYSKRQRDYCQMLMDYDMVFSSGPAGTGKTYIAVAMAVFMFLTHKVERIILCRPAIEAGEKIGFLPGDMKEKVDPYMQPIYDALHEMLPTNKIQRYLESRVIEIAPLAFMRGRTLKDAFVILDEAQNATPTQMKMFLTRLGENSRMAINGDLTQVDLPGNIQSGLENAWDKLQTIDEIGFMTFDEDDVVRHSLVTKIVKTYNAKS